MYSFYNIYHFVHWYSDLYTCHSSLFIPTHLHSGSIAISLKEEIADMLPFPYSLKVHTLTLSKTSFFNVYLFWEREGGLGKRQREREKENPKQALHCQHGAQCQAQTDQAWDHELSRNQQSDVQPTEPPRHPIIKDFLTAKSNAHFEVHSFIHSFIQQMVIEHLLCAKHCSGL